MINTEKPFHLLKFDHCDFVNVESSVRHHMSITHKPFQCEKNMFSDIMKTHIIYSLFKYPLKTNDFDFDFAHSPYDPKFTNCLLRGEGQQVFFFCESCDKS